MCWSAPVSLMFGLIHTMLAYRIFKGGPNKYYAYEFLMFTCFYALMEYLQFFQWMIGTADVAGTADMSKTCPLANTSLTIGAYFLIWAQPLLFSWIGYTNIFAGLRTSTSQAYRKGFYTFAIAISTIILVVALINLIAGFGSSSVITISTNLGNQTCTYLGQYGHLDWRFRIRWIDFQPTYLIYLSIIALCIIFLDPHLRYILGLGWGGTFVLSFLLVAGSSEFPAYWCWLSVFADIPILIYTLGTKLKIIR